MTMHQIGSDDERTRGAWLLQRVRGVIAFVKLANDTTMDRFTAALVETITRVTQDIEDIFGEDD